LIQDFNFFEALQVENKLALEIFRHFVLCLLKLIPTRYCNLQVVCVCLVEQLDAEHRDSFESADTGLVTVFGEVVRNTGGKEEYEAANKVSVDLIQI